jgi:hypothetical protein
VYSYRPISLAFVTRKPHLLRIITRTVLVSPESQLSAMSCAFVPPGGTSFTGASAAAASARATSARPARSVVTAMAKGNGKKPGFSLPNPFGRKAETPAPTGFAEPQPGDPNYKPPKYEKFELEDESKPGPPSKNKAKAEAAAKAEAEAALEKAKKSGKLPVMSGQEQAEAMKMLVEEKKRGFELLREDLLKSAPERIGVGRQDTTTLSTPSFGEPGYKRQAFEVAKVSSLGISPFPDDANAVGKVGGLEAVQRAARLAAQGKSEKSIKAKFLKKPVVVAESEKVYDIPDYLKPLPEDTPRNRMTWKNYSGK